MGRKSRHRNFDVSTEIPTFSSSISLAQAILGEIIHYYNKLERYEKKQILFPADASSSDVGFGIHFVQHGRS